MDQAPRRYCPVSNGTYSCDRPPGHTGTHRNAFRSGGEPRIARWDNAYGEVRFYRPRRDPKPPQRVSKP